MRTTTTPQRSKSRQYRRRLVPATDGQYGIKSLTKDDDTRYTIAASPSGVITCTCPAATYNPGTLCKHGVRLRDLMERHAEAKSAPPFNVRCAGCGTTTADSYLHDFDAAGRPIPGRWLCDACANAQIGFTPDEAEEYSAAPVAHRATAALDDHADMLMTVDFEGEAI